MAALTRRALLLGSLAWPFVMAIPKAKRRRYNTAVRYDSSTMLYNRAV